MRKKRKGSTKTVAMITFSAMYFIAALILHQNAPIRSVNSLDMYKNAHNVSSFGTEKERSGIGDFSPDDEEALKCIAMAEAEGEGVYGKALVMMVVLNRKKSEEFPNTIKDVIFEERQFETTFEGGRYYSVTPDQECEKALYLIKTGWDESGGALYFESGTGETWHSRNLNFLYRSGGHKFYK